MMRRSHRRTARTTPVTTTTRTKKPSLFSRLTRPRPATNTTTTRRSRHNHHTTTAAPVAPVTATHHHHHQRRPSISDRISGALLKLKGTVTGRPGQKAAGTRRMRGTDGRGSTATTRRRRW
ncbi:hypothetical protein K440DRAFT_131350 [Wilcoxina mikolae CBS 423.85]|nr:hypothetical protein K440DRAFT_131350 [Wilcoxina mikolae CBS 423.85]